MPPGTLGEDPRVLRAHRGIAFPRRLSDANIFKPDFYSRRIVRRAWGLECDGLQPFHHLAEPPLDKIIERRDVVVNEAVKRIGHGSAIVLLSGESFGARYQTHLDRDTSLSRPPLQEDRLDRCLSVAPLQRQSEPATRGRAAAAPTLGEAECTFRLAGVRWPQLIYLRCTLLKRTPRDA